MCRVNAMRTFAIQHGISQYPIPSGPRRRCKKADQPVVFMSFKYVHGIEFVLIKHRS